MKRNPSDQERRYKEQVINQNKDNANTNNINGKFVTNVIPNCISNSFKNINNSAMKDTDNMKEITNKNIGSNKEITESTKKDVRRKEKIIRNASENCRNAPFEKISENDKTNFKCNFENVLKNLRKKNMHKIAVGQININSIRNKFDHLTAAVWGNIDILLITDTKTDSTFPRQMPLTSTSEEVSVKIENEIIKNSLQEKLLGIVVDNRLTFEPHLKNLCKKAGEKLHALARIANYMDISKKRSIVNAFILSQFSYCPLIWMFHITCIKLSWGK